MAGWNDCPDMHTLKGKAIPSSTEEEFDANWDKIIHLPLKLSPRESQFHLSRLETNRAKIRSNDTFRNFFNNIVESSLVANQYDKHNLVSFMIANPGVSVWCVALRKVIENSNL